jgi:hypothetical protein
VPIPVIAPRLGLYADECNNVNERRFLERLNQRAERGGWYTDSWSHTTDHLLVAISLVRDNCVYRDLRVDFFGDVLRFGDDETHQFVTPLDPANPGVTEVVLTTPEAMAEAAADWFERELAADAAARGT